MNECSHHMQGWLYVRPFLPSEGLHAFREQVGEYTKSHFNISLISSVVDLGHSVALYDAILILAHAVTKVMSEGSRFQDGQAVTEALRSISIAGIAQHAVSLDSQGDAILQFELMKYAIAANCVMESVPVGIYDSTSFIAYDVAVRWPANMTEVPVDWVPIRKCGSGEYMNATGCAECPAGLYQDARSHSSTLCTMCSPGTYAPAPGTRKCSACKVCSLHRLSCH